jgi:nucleotide-binding universal stress UspA family protein
MNTIIVGYDSTESSGSALRWAGRLARSSGASVHVVHVISSVGEWEESAFQIDTDAGRHNAEQMMRDRWTAPLRDADVAYRTTVVVGDPRETLMDIARRESADLIVVGSTTKGRMQEAVIGSVPKALLHHARRPVVVVPTQYEQVSSSSATKERLV